MPDAFQEFNEGVSAVFQIATFFVFGALVVATGWEGSIWPLLLYIAFALLIARPAAVLLSFVGVEMPGPHKLFVAWFGPKGVASMLFALFVLGSTADERTLDRAAAGRSLLGAYSWRTRPSMPPATVTT